MSSVSQLAGYFTRIFDTKIKSCFQILENAEMLIEPEQQLLEDGVMEKLELVVTKTDFSDMGAVDLQGNARNINGKAANIYDVQFVQEVLAGNRYISDTAYNKEGKPYLLLAIPMH